MVFVDSSGEYLGQSGRRPSSTDSEASYAEISSDDSYFSDGGDLAEYWDPYCEYSVYRQYRNTTHQQN